LKCAVPEIPKEPHSKKERRQNGKKWINAFLIFSVLSMETPRLEPLEVAVGIVNIL